MKCPYCEQDHPDGMLICPNTGRSLGEFSKEETGDQLPIQGQAEEPARPVAVPAASTQELPGYTLSPGEEPPLSSTEGELSGAGLPTEIKKKRSAGPWVIGGCVGIPLFIVLVLVLVIFADPFKLHLWGRVTGKYDAAAEVMPADTGLYLGINIGNGALTRFGRVIEPFMPVDQSSVKMGSLPSHIDPKPALQTSPYGDVLQQIEDETGIKIPGDVSPWIGQYAGIGVVEFKDTGEVIPTPTGYILAIEARNLHRADEFLTTLQGNLAEKQSMDFENQTYQGAKIVVEKTSASQTGMAFGRSGRMILLASSLDILHEAVDRQDSQALPAEKDYTGLTNIRPRDWTASIYLNHAWIGDYLNTIMGSSLSTAGPVINPYTGINWTGILINVSAIQGGARLDVYMDYDETTQTASEVAELQKNYVPPGQVIDLLPKDTLFFIISNRFNFMLENILKSSGTSESEISSFWEAGEQSLGFSLKDDLVDRLSGDWALYAVPSTRGLLPAQAELNLALNLLVQTDGRLDLQPVTDGLSRNEMVTGFTVDKKQRDGFTYYELGLYGDVPLFAFSANDTYFTLGTDGDKLQLSPGEDNLLVKSDNYQAALQALPKNMVPVVYIDLESFLANVREGIPASDRQDFNDSIRAVAPILTIAAGGAYLSERGIIRSTIVIMLAEN